MENSTDQTTQQLMFSLIEIWRSSNLTQQEFCREKDLNYQRFHYWLRKYKVIRGETKSDKAGPSFVKVDLSSMATTGVIELCLPDGRKLIFHPPVDVAFLRGLLW
jgi:hypothetical protein